MTDQSLNPDLVVSSVVDFRCLRSHLRVELKMSRHNIDKESSFFHDDIITIGMTNHHHLTPSDAVGVMVDVRGAIR